MCVCVLQGILLMQVIKHTESKQNMTFSNKLSRDNWKEQNFQMGGTQRVLVKTYHLMDEEKVVHKA